MFARALPALRTPVAAALRTPTATRVPAHALRSISTSAMLQSDNVPPIWTGVGAKPGEMPTNETQSTGIERLEWEALKQGIDLFDYKPLQITKPGTLKEPTPVDSYGETRPVGCSGFPKESHDPVWLLLQKGKVARCPECGNVYDMIYRGPEHEEGHGHH